MTRQRIPGRHRTPSRTLPLTQPRRAAAVALVATTGLASSHGPLSDAAPTHPDVSPAAVPTRSTPDATTVDALAMLREVHPEMARQARQTRRLGTDLTHRAEAATAAAKTRHGRASAAALAKRARHTRALGRELTAQAEAVAEGITLVARFAAGQRPHGTVAQLSEQLRAAEAADAFLFPLAVTARAESAHELTAARSAAATARTSKAKAKARSRVVRAEQDVELARLFVRAADIVRLETKRIRTAHAAMVAATTARAQPAAPVPAPEATPTPTHMPQPNGTPPTTRPGMPAESHDTRAPLGGASPVVVPTQLL